MKAALNLADRPEKCKRIFLRAAPTPPRALPGAPLRPDAEDGGEPLRRGLRAAVVGVDAVLLLLDEWGGFKYLLPADRKGGTGWGYNGLCFTKEKDFLERIGAQTRLFASMKELAGWCYTQLTDVEQEQNGVYTYDRRAKAAPKRLAAVFDIRPKWSAW